MMKKSEGVIQLKEINTIIVGGGQAGLAVSYFLRQHQIEHLVLEQALQPCHAWRDQRWDSFSLLTPNWTIRMPGMQNHTSDPDGFLRREEVIAFFEQYITRFNLPIQYGVQVKTVAALPDARGYTVETNQDEYKAENVVMATGLFQGPKVPAYSINLSRRVMQLHSTEYRNPLQLPVGGVLVIGSAQSGAQIAEELHESGRKVYLAVGSAGRVPRRYRGKDIYYWLDQMGFFDRTPDMLVSPRLKFAANPHLSGKNGGHTINLHLFARMGIQLLGHVVSGENERLTFADDLKQSLIAADQFEADVVTKIDSFIAGKGLSAPGETLPALQDGCNVKTICSLNLESEGIHSIIWAQGFAFDYSMVQLPVTDQDGFPKTRQGVTDFPGLCFVGMPFLHKQKSGLLLGVGEDAEYIASHLISRRQRGSGH